MGSENAHIKTYKNRVEEDDVEGDVEDDVEGDTDMTKTLDTFFLMSLTLLDTLKYTKTSKVRNCFILH